MIKLSKVRLPSNARTDDNGKLCIIRKIHSYEELLEISFDSIRFHAAGNIFVSVHILKTLRKIMTHLKDEGRREAVAKLAKTIVNGNEERITEQKDLDYLHNEYQKLTIPY